MAATVATVAVLAAGCSGGAPPASQAQAATSHSAAAGLAVGAQRQALAARYLAVAVAGNHRLEAEFGRLHKQDRNQLAAAHRDLLQVAARPATARHPFPAGDRADRPVPVLGQ